MAVTFDITPEQEATTLSFVKRQLFSKIPPVIRADADLTGKTALITGANVGLGLECARHFLDLGCSKVILAVRSEAKGDAARRDLSQGRDLKPDAIEVWPLDLASYDSITTLVERARRLPRLDLAVLNAGLFKATEVFHPTTSYEEDVQINYLSNALLLTLLAPVMAAATPAGAAPGRIVLVSSDMAGWCKFAERSAQPLLPAFRRKMAPKWDYGERYGTSKLLGQLYLTELAKRVPASQVTLALANPGMTHGSELGREGNFLERAVVGAVFRVLGRPTAVSARTYVYAAVARGEEAHGQHFEDSTLHPYVLLLPGASALRA